MIGKRVSLCFIMAMAFLAQAVDILMVGWTASRPFSFIFTFLLLCILFLFAGYRFFIDNKLIESYNEQDLLELLASRLKRLSEDKRKQLIDRIINETNEFASVDSSNNQTSD